MDRGRKTVFTHKLTGKWIAFLQGGGVMGYPHEYQAGELSKIAQKAGAISLEEATSTGPLAALEYLQWAGKWKTSKNGGKRFYTRVEGGMPVGTQAPTASQEDLSGIRAERDQALQQAEFQCNRANSLENILRSVHRVLDEHLQGTYNKVVEAPLPNMEL